MTEKKQIDKFKDAAREADCDPDEATFKDKLKKLASAPSVIAAKKVKSDKAIGKNKK